MFTCFTSPVALLNIEVYEATDTVCADTGASQSVGGELMFKFLKNHGQKFSEFHLAMCLADDQQSTSLVQKATVTITIGGRTFQIDLIFLPHAKVNLQDPFSKDAPLPVDDCPDEINSTSCPTNSIPIRKELLRKEIDNLLADIYQEQVEKGGLIDIEAGKNKYLLEISNAPTRSNTAENSVPDEANDVDATPETDSSTKPEENASVMPKDRASGSKDMRIGSSNDQKIKIGNQRFNRYPKPNEQRFHRFKNRGRYSPERFNVVEHYTEVDYLPQIKADSEDYSAEAHHDTSPVTDLSPIPRSYIPSNKRNERTNYYDSNRKYGGEKKENFYHRSNSDTRGRSEVNNKSDCDQISNESLNEASESISPSDKECFQNNTPECDDKDESKRQDICAGNSSNCAFFDHQRRNVYRSDTHFQDRRRDSFKRGRQNRGYRNQYNERQHPSSYRENNYHDQGGKFVRENHFGRSYNRGSLGNSYRYSHEENLHYSNDKKRL
ncbi:retrovirus-related Pol polyprotein from transposon 17.6 [Trichonephila inaurata madagascariensis]|uniref:Retrovirus-related Pol polyprotein from transposon 17.6 n=1 Tax=Trichonephila inaurata madagascariensis TaxID=2747483 RepID=A0A8X6YNL3_9ARAC|nr:retrovirus-related Pol polyprotein from transposon 17.6 [Trichonephila inaurata madagascariensis]